MQLSAPHQAPSHVSGLQLCALSWRMSREIPGDRNEDVPTLVGVAPLAELADASLQDLMGVETLAQ